MRRTGLAVLVGLIAMICLSSSLLAAIVGGVTVVVVAIDMLAQSRRELGPASPDPWEARELTPEAFTVDLRRRP